jgi:uncharacterized protein YeeX (DUF496 family)
MSTEKREYFGAEGEYPEWGLGEGEVQLTIEGVAASLPVGIKQDTKGGYLVNAEHGGERRFVGRYSDIEEAEKALEESRRALRSRSDLEFSARDCVKRVVSHTIREHCATEEEIEKGEKKHYELLDLVLDYICAENPDIFPREIEYIIWAEYENKLEPGKIEKSERRKVRTEMKEAIKEVCEECRMDLRKLHD